MQRIAPIVLIILFCSQLAFAQTRLSSIRTTLFATQTMTHPVTAGTKTITSPAAASLPYYNLKLAKQKLWIGFPSAKLPHNQIKAAREKVHFQVTPDTISIQSVHRCFKSRQIIHTEQDCKADSKRQEIIAPVIQGSGQRRIHHFYRGRRLPNLSVE